MLQDRIYLLRSQNMIMLAVIAILMIIGVFFVYSACYASIEQETRFLYVKQMVWILVGLACYAGIIMLDAREMRSYAWWLYAGTLILLLWVMVAGSRVHGARSWLNIFGLNVQPSEFAKLAIVFVMARMMTSTNYDGSSIGRVLLMLLVVTVPILLIMKQPDMGTAAICLPIVFLMMFCGGVSGRILGTMALVGVLIAGAVLGLLFLPEKMKLDQESQSVVMKKMGLGEHHKKRLLVFLNIDSDPQGAGWNKIQSKIAVGSGGLTGKGWRKGTQNILGFLPKFVAPTDFIYSVIAEEEGFVGSVMVIFLYAVLIGYGINVAINARDRFDQFLCVGVVSMIFMHVFVNIAMTVGILPIIGVPLPLLSYGGSFMVVVMTALGIVQSIHVRSHRLAER